MAPAKLWSDPSTWKISHVDVDTTFLFSANLTCSPSGSHKSTKANGVVGGETKPSDGRNEPTFLDSVDIATGKPNFVRVILKVCKFKGWCVLKDARSHRQSGRASYGCRSGNRPRTIDQALITLSGKSSKAADSESAGRRLASNSIGKAWKCTPGYSGKGYTYSRYASYPSRVGVHICTTDSNPKVHAKQKRETFERLMNFNK